MTIGISKISKNRSSLKVVWSDGEISNFNFMWLRDNCPTAHDKILIIECSTFLRCLLILNQRYIN